MNNANNIKTLNAIEHIRKRPRMYFESDHSPTYAMVWEVVGEAIIQCQSPGKNTITVTLLDDDFFSISHDGRSYPPYNRGNGVSHFQHTLSEHPGPGLHLNPKPAGPVSFILPLYMINAASCKVIAQTRYDGYLWQQEYEAGLPVTQVIRVARLENPLVTGTTIQFQPDVNIIGPHETHIWEIYWQLQPLSKLFDEIEFILDDRRSNPEYEQSIRVVNHVRFPPLHEPLSIEVLDEKDDIYGIHIQYRDSMLQSVYTYHHDREKETIVHVIEEIRQYFNSFLNENGGAPPDTLTRSDVCTGLSVTVSREKDPSRIQFYQSAYKEILSDTLQNALNNLRMDDTVMFYRMIEKCLVNRHYRVSQQ